MIKCCGFWSLVKCEFLDTDFSLAILPATSRLLAMADKQVICLVVCNQAFSNKYRLGHSIFNNRIYFGSNRNRYCINKYNISDKLFGVVILGRMAGVGDVDVLIMMQSKKIFILLMIMIK
jgi:hypothetical protein